MAGDYDDGRNQRGFSGNDWDEFQHGRNDRARWDTHTAGPDKPAGHSGGAPPGGSGGPVGGGGLAILLVAIAGLVVVLPAGLLALAATPVLTLIGRWRPEARTFRALFLPMWKACFAFLALHALGLLILTYGGSLVSADLSAMTAAFIDTLIRVATGDLPWPGLGPLARVLGALLPVVILALVLAVIVPLCGMAFLLRLGLSGRHVQISFRRALALSAGAMLGASVLIAALVALRLPLGRPLPTPFLTWGVGTVVVSAIISGLAGGLFALLATRPTGRPAALLARTAVPALLFWTIPGGLAFHVFRGADPLVVTLLYPGGGIEPQAFAMGLPAFLLMQLPGAAFCWRWMAASGFWVPGRPALLATLALLALATGIGAMVLMVVVRMMF